MPEVVDATPPAHVAQLRKLVQAFKASLLPWVQELGARDHVALLEEGQAPRSASRARTLEALRASGLPQAPAWIAMLQNPAPAGGGYVVITDAEGSGMIVDLLTPGGPARGGEAC